MIARGPKRILCVALRRELVDGLAGSLKGNGFEVDYVFRGTSALLLSGDVSFDLLIVEPPLPDMALEVFVEGLQAADSASAAADLMLMGSEESLGARARPGRPMEARYGLSHTEYTRSELKAIAGDVLGVAPRAEARGAVKLRLMAPSNVKSRDGESENVSRTGMFIKTDTLPPVGSVVALEWSPPGAEGVVRVEAEVVRHSAEAEPAHGVGVRFLGIDSESAKLLEGFLARSEVAA